jgi:hypothetical protein
MANIDFWALAERVRLDFDDKIEFLALHPRLCEENGERFMKQVLNSEMLFITSACPEKRQEKILRDGFEKANVTMDSAHWIPINMAQETTESVYNKIKTLLEKEG